MEDVLCNITIVKENEYFVAHIESDYGGSRDFKSKNFEEVLEQVNTELTDEFDN